MLSARCHYSPEPVVRLLPTQRTVRDRILRDLHFGQLPVESSLCLCGANGGIVLAERDRWGLPVRTVLCERCGVVRTDPRLTEAALPLFYSRDYRLLMDGTAEPTAAAFDLQVRRGREAVAFVESVVPLGANTRVCEVGCSAGGVLWAFHERGCPVAGSDYDSSFVAYGRRRGLALRAGSLDELLTEPPADLLILSHIVEHQNSPAAFLRDAFRLVRPGGWVVIAVPGLEHIREDYCGNWLLYLQICHTYHFTRLTLSGLVDAARLTVEKSDESVRILARRGPDPDPRGNTERESPSRVRAVLEELERDWQGQEPRQRLRRRVRQMRDAICGIDS